MKRADLDILPEAFGMCITNLFTAFGKQLDRPTGLMYWRALHDVPVPMLDAAVGKAVRERTWLPKPAEVRHDAEACRLAVRERFAWTSCGQCSQQGWIEEDVDGVKRAVRCLCVERNAVILRELGADGPTLLEKPREIQTEPVDTRLLAAGEDR